MLRLFLVCCAFVGLAVAELDCVRSSPSLSLPSCMDECFLTGGCNSSQCPCPQNLKGWCEISSGEGPDSWFSRWGQCVVDKCPDDGDITNLMLLFTAQCAGTVGGPLTNDTVPYPLRDWMPRNTFRSTTIPASTATLGASQSVATLTGVASAGITTAGFMSLSSDTTSDSEATVIHDEASSASRATGTASSAPTQDGSKPGLSVAAIIGIAVGGTVLLALVIGPVAFFLRRRRRKDSARSVLPPSYESADNKEGYEKPELDGQALGYQHAGVGVGASVVYAELDGGGPMSPVGELAGRS